MTLHNQNIWISDFSELNWIWTESCADKFTDTETCWSLPKPWSLGKQAQWTWCGRCRCGSQCQMRPYSKTECQQTSPDTLPDGWRDEKDQVSHGSDYHVLQTEQNLLQISGSILNTRTVYSLRAWTGQGLLFLTSLCSKRQQQHQIKRCFPTPPPSRSIQSAPLCTEPEAIDQISVGVQDTTVLVHVSPSCFPQTEWASCLLCLGPEWDHRRLMERTRNSPAVFLQIDIKISASDTLKVFCW